MAVVKRVLSAEAKAFDRVLTFIKKLRAEDKINWRTNQKDFLGNLYIDVPTREEEPKRLAYSLVIRPERGGEEVKIRLYKEKRKGFEPSWLYVYTSPNARFYYRRRANNVEYKHLAHKGKFFIHYPILDLEDESIKGLKFQERKSKEFDIAGKTEVVLNVPDDVFDKLKEDVILGHYAREARSALKDAIKEGKIRKVGENEKEVLKKIIDIIKNTDGKALKISRKLSLSDVHKIWKELGEKFGEHDRIGQTFLKTIRFSIENSLGDLSDPEKLEENKERVINNLLKFFEENGIEIDRQLVERAVERVIENRKRITWEEFSEFLNNPVEKDKKPKDFVHSIVIIPENVRVVPEKRKYEEKIRIRLLEERGSKSPFWVYEYIRGDSPYSFYYTKNVNKEDINHLKPRRGKINKNNIYYTILDLEDGRISHLVCGLREKEGGDMEGAREAILMVPNEVFEKLKEDIIISHNERVTSEWKKGARRRRPARKRR